MKHNTMRKFLVCILVVALLLSIFSFPTLAQGTDSSYTLTDNTALDNNGNWTSSGGYWNEKWANYNCYAFAINRAEPDPFYETSKQYQPGDIGGTGTFTEDITVQELAELVRDDLLAMGCTDISLSSTPIYDSSKELICVRLGFSMDFTTRRTTYHFMRYDFATAAWYHKPGNTAVLKYNYTPNSNVNWSNELCTSQGPEMPYGYTVYDSEIIFITYTKKEINVVGSDNTSQAYIHAGKDVFYDTRFETSGNYNIQVAANSAVLFTIYDEDFDIIGTSSGNNPHACLSVTATQTYYLRINYTNTAIEGNVNISISPYSSDADLHAYNAYYTWESMTRHKSHCTCGDYTHNAHVVAAGSISKPNFTARCLLCNGPASEGFTNMSIGDLPHTANGSYILPSGTIVLVDEDIEAYMNGQLIFTEGDLQ